MKQQVLDCFAKLFGGEGDIRTYFAPGRVNLIGEHTDYNGGHVFPCALTIGTYMAARKRDDRKLRFYSMNFEKLGVVESSLDEFQMGKEGNWTAYPKGMMWAFCQKGFPVEQGFDIVLYGNIPNGSGLSSSASVETVTGVMLRDMFGYDTISMIGIALYGQFSENNYNGVNCGIMDQFAIAMGKKAHQMILDALAALTAEDETAARKVIAADDEVDYDFNAIKHTLAREIAADPGKVDAALDLLMVIKYLERIGDHAVNLAEWVEFVRTGCYHNETLF